VLRVLFQRKVVLFGFFVIAAIILAAIFAPLLTPYSPNKVDMAESLLQPSKQHLLGTDEVGRDVLTRIVYGARISLIIGVGVAVIGGVIGTILGLVGGYLGGITEMVIMRFIDSLLSIPSIFLSLTIAALLGAGLKNVMIALTVSTVPAYARIMYSQVITIKESDHIMSAISLGSSNLRIMLIHIVPNAFPQVLVLVTMLIGLTILAEAGLSFLGIGVIPPTATWGNMISEGRKYLLTNPLISLASGSVVMLVVFAFNMVGDGLRDALDPRLRGTL
jgi:peptide/nickel transport system permease protein